MKFNLKEYSREINDLDKFGVIAAGLIEGLLEEKGMPVHSVRYRIKSPESVARKIGIQEKSYKSLSDLTDLLGFRIITYFAEDVDEVSRFISQEFKIDEGNSIDKRKILEADKFGYLSVHYVAELSVKRKALAEYRRFKNIKFEIQIRSILQHAWAEIEHDIGYKSEKAIPKTIRRRFSRLAGLLEIADAEFERLRLDKNKYEKKVKKEINTSPRALSLDQSTVVEALDSQKELIQLEQEIAKAVGKKIEKQIDPSYAGSMVEDLKILGVKDIQELLEIAEKYKDQIIKFVKLWIPPHKHSSQSMKRGIGLFYISYALVAQAENDDELKDWGQTISGRRGGLIESVKSTWNMANKSKK